MGNLCSVVVAAVCSLCCAELGGLVPVLFCAEGGGKGPVAALGMVVVILQQCLRNL